MLPIILGFSSTIYKSALECMQKLGSNKKHKVIVCFTCTCNHEPPLDSQAQKTIRVQLQKEQKTLLKQKLSKG